MRHPTQIYSVCYSEEASRPGRGAGQDMQGARRMPWHGKPTKDAASRDSPGVGAHGRRSRGLRMGEPARRSACTSLGNTYLGRGQPGELKHLSTRRRRNQHRDPPSSGERKGAEAKPRSAYGRQASRPGGCRAGHRGSAGPRVCPSGRAERHGKAGGTGLEPRRPIPRWKAAPVPE